MSLPAYHKNDNSDKFTNHSWKSLESESSQEGKVSDGVKYQKKFEGAEAVGRVSLNVLASHLPPPAEAKPIAAAMPAPPANAPPVLPLPPPPITEAVALPPPPPPLDLQPLPPPPRGQFESRYKLDAVWDRFYQKYGADKSEEELIKISEEAEAMAQYAWAASNADNIDNIRGDLKTKAGGIEVADEAVYGKMFALSLKIVNLVTNPQTKVGEKLLPSHISKAGIKKESPASRLLRANLVIHSTTDELGKTEHRGMLIIRHLGAGSFNTASLVYHQHLKRELVLRELDIGRIERKYPGQAQSYHADWVKEVDLHKRLLKANIPGLVGLHEVYVLDSPGKPKVKALLMEKGDGDCKALTSTTKKLSDINRKSAFKQRVTTLAGMHKEGVVHRDYKPENVFYSINNQGEIVTKVADFGFAKNAESTLGEQDGTAAYKPLDGFLRFDNGRQLNVHIAKLTDAWAEGLTAYELRYGSFMQYRNLGTQIRELSVNFFKDANNVAAFQEYANSKSTDTVSNRRKNLLEALKQNYPPTEASATTYLELDAFIERLTDEQFISYVHDQILMDRFGSQFIDMFKPICEELAKGDEEDKMIARLLEPNVAAREMPEHELPRLGLIT